MRTWRVALHVVPLELTPAALKSADVMAACFVAKR